VEPEPETAALYERIRRGWKPEGSKVEEMLSETPGLLPTAAQPSNLGPSNFPTYLTPFLGRESELQDITKLLLDPGAPAAHPDRPRRDRQDAPGHTGGFRGRGAIRRPGGGSRRGWNPLKMACPSRMGSISCL